jgi:hypothetical protein
MLFPSLPRKMPPRMPAGLPANFKGIPDGKDKLAEHIQKDAGGVAFNPVSAGVGAMTFDTLKSLKRRIKGFLGLDAFEQAFRNKFTLRGAANFTGEYPPELVAARQKAAKQV